MIIQIFLLICRHGLLLSFCCYSCLSVPPKMLKGNKVPVYIVEDHNDALNFILRGIGSKRIPFENNLLIHFDSHPDLLIDTKLKAIDVFDKYCLLEKVSIETWILPLAQAGHISTIVWLKPKWSNQIDDGVYSFFIGEDGNGNVKVSSELLYFISALNFAPKEDLSNCKEVFLHVMTIDGTEECVSECSEKLVSLIKKFHNYLLDIDLDFFCTCNPFLQLYPLAGAYEVLKVLYKFTENDILKAPSMKEAQRMRAKQVEKLESIFSWLEKTHPTLSDSFEEEFSNRFGCYFEMDVLKNLIKCLLAEYGENGVDWLAVHDAGTTIDDPDRPLPHHYDILAAKLYIRIFSQLIATLPPPKIISIARSANDGYTPSNEVNFLQEEVSSSLARNYTVDVKLHYLDEIHSKYKFGNLFNFIIIIIIH